MDQDVPRDHPSLEQYPDRPTYLARIDGVLWRMPMRDDYDAAVPVPVTDLMQARSVIGLLERLVHKGIVDDPVVLKMIGRTAVVGSNEAPPLTAGEVERWLRDLRSRINAWMPHY
ncbi:hypothetical protein AB1207_22085 [Kineococcus endophyticus]|uniref:Uncharacterized protein n=1 Tax=Kineococcus endophyticus TaxID=1181883 RepID=A0ABV3PCS2_9ACTN